MPTIAILFASAFAAIAAGGAAEPPLAHSDAPMAWAQQASGMAPVAPPAMPGSDVAPNPPAPLSVVPAGYEQSERVETSATNALHNLDITPSRRPTAMNVESPIAPPATRPANTPPAPAARAPEPPPVTKSAAKSDATVAASVEKTSLPLDLLGGHNQRGAAGGKPSGISALVTVVSSLAIVLSLFFVLAWAMRKAAPRGSVILPSEVFEILGRAPLSGRQQVQLLRCGSKILLVSVTPTGAETLTEVIDPVEVDRLAGLCRASRPGSSSNSFRQVFQHLVSKSDPLKDIDDIAPPVASRRKGYRWEDDHE